MNAAEFVLMARRAEWRIRVKVYEERMREMFERVVVKEVMLDG